MANVWRNGRWEDDATGNVLVGGQPGPNGTWAGGTWTNPQGGTYNAQTGQWSQPGSDPLWNAQGAQLEAQQAQIKAKQGVVQAGQGALGASYATNAAQQAALPFRMATLSANRGVLSAQQGTFGPQASVIEANRGVNAAQGAVNAGQRGYIQQRQGENQLQAGEFEAALSAKNNVADQAAVAQAKRFYAVKDARARRFGMAPEAEVSVPVGFTGKLGAGLRAAPTTQGEDVERTNKENQTRRAYQLEGAQLAVQLLGTNVDAARLVAAERGLTLDQAQLMVSMAQNAAGFAGNAEDVANVGVSAARLNEDRAQLGVRGAGLLEDEASIGASQADLNARIASRAPFPGAEKYVDPFTGRSEWLTPSEKDQKDYQYSLQLSHERIPDQFELQQARDQGGAVGGAVGGPGGKNDPYSVYTPSQLLNMYVPSEAYTSPFGYNGPQSNPIEEALVRKLIQQKYSPEDARKGAKLLIETEMTKRLNDAQKRAPTAQEDIN